MKSFKKIIDYLKQDTEIVVVVDDESDSTVQATEKFENINLLINSYGPGPALAIKYAIDNTKSKSVCVQWVMEVMIQSKLRIYFFLLKRVVRRCS